MNDIIRRKGMAAFGTRLRRLSERLDRQVAALYRAHNIGFEPRWFPVVTLLREQGGLSVGELATAIGITHAAVSQVRSALVRRRLVRATADPADRRRQVLQLTDKGQALCSKLDPLWQAVAAATEALASEVPGFLDRFARIEDALERNPMNVRAGILLVARPRKNPGEKNVKARRH